jgi:phage terminase small subunit
MMKADQRNPPSYLSRRAKTWYREIVGQYVFTTAAEWRLLEEAAAVLDRITQCRERIKAEGLTVPTGHGGVKPHPCLNAERDNRILFARLCRELRLGEPSQPEKTRIPRISE